MAVDPSEKFKQILNEFDTAMFVTQTPTGELRSRPMIVADHLENGDLLFLTSAETGKTEEAIHHPQVNVTMQSPDKFLSLSGVVTLSFDRELIKKLWKPSWRSWFPKGKDDPDLALLRITTTAGDYWDVSGATQIKFLFHGGKTLIQR